MKPGTYRTAAGSELRVQVNGMHSVSFDWVEEEGACIECRPNPYPDDEGFLVWTCDDHDGGKARLIEYAETRQ